VSAAVATPRPNEALCIDVSVPVTRVGVGPFSLDPLEQLLGAPLPELLAPVLVGPVTRRPSRAGPALDVYPLALPDGASLLLPLGPWGELGLRNERGLLVLTVPWGLATWLRQRLGDALVRGPEPALSSDGTARVALAWVRVTAGMTVSVPLGSWGEVGVGVVT